MLSRRALLAGGVATFAAPPILARAQNSTDSAGAAPTILRLERRNIEVNGKTARSTASGSQTGPLASPPKWASPFAFASKTASTNRA
jgi:hypothetical protein